MICPVDKLHGEFLGPEELADHMATSHSEMMPSPDFIKVVEQVEHKKPKQKRLNGKVTEDLTHAPKPPTPDEVARQALEKPREETYVNPSKKGTPVVEAKPITLEYRYTGQHECGSVVETLEVDVENKHFVIAFCPAEKVQVESREVANLYERKTTRKS